MKGQITVIVIIAILLIPISLIVFSQGSKNIITVISNSTTTINNTNYVGGGIIPAVNVSAGTFGNGTGDYVFPNSLTINGNTTLNGLIIFNNNLTYGEYCNIHRGTQINYSRCFNSTGQSIETIGVFPV